MSSNFSRLKSDENGKLILEYNDKTRNLDEFAFIDKNNENKLIDFFGNVFYDPKVLEDLKSQILSGTEVMDLLQQNKMPKPGAVAYIRGKLMYYDITHSSISNFNLGYVQDVLEKTGNYTIFTTDNNTNFDKISDSLYFIVKRKDENNIPSDIPIPFKIEIVDESTNKLKAISVNLDNYSIDEEGDPPDIQVGDLIIQSGVWELLLAQETDLMSLDEKKLSKEYLSNQLKVIQNQIEILTSYKSSLENAGYSEDDPEYIKTVRQLNYQQALKEFYSAILDCETCDPNDESTWNDEVIAKKENLDEAKHELELPPPSTKEIIIKTIDRIGLSVMGSIDIYLTGYYEDPPSVTQAGVPDYISNVNLTNTHTSHFSGTSVGIKGINENLGVNYLLVKGSYNTDVKGTSNLSFVIDIAKVAGVEAQRGNYKYEAFSALFKVREHNFWDYTGGNVTWEYFVNMTPLTNDSSNPDYGKFRIDCQIKAYKDYHNANLGARWFATLNKIKGF